MIASKPKYDVSIILINYNSSSYTLACVKSILDKSGEDVNFNIIVVDNCSQTDDYQKIKNLSEIRNITVVRSKLNLGFAGGHMFGLQFTNAKYYFFLNNDCLFLNDCIAELYAFCENHQNAGMCSPQMYSVDRNPVPSFDYFPILSSKILGTGIVKFIQGKDYHYRKKIYQEAIKVDVISGSQMFVRATSLNDLGGLDTNFFLYCEEEDLSLRMYKHGFDTYVVPAAKNIHIGSGSTEKSLVIQKEFYISFLYFYRKHYGMFKTEVLRLILCLRLLKKVFSKMDSFRLLGFVMFSANMTKSLRHSQKIAEL
ncbi:hypothetical protein MNBD_GAMMA25-44 [hydrothermal vent metagenome]|uniref:Glycosyltransferase 2-like domain-containing protein n=1 Tax=hydrothermal vent metagenome TaxID=652676 RepID=A0A3B1BI82_9ZZZZ